MEEAAEKKRKESHVRKASIGSSDEEDFAVVSQADKGEAVSGNKRMRLQEQRVNVNSIDEGAEESEMDVDSRTDVTVPRRGRPPKWVKLFKAGLITEV